MSGAVPQLRFPGFEGSWTPVSMGEALERASEAVEVDPTETYREIGVRSHGRGVFHKGPLLGEELGNKRVFRVVPDALVLNIVFAWEQAVAMTSDEEVGFIASHRFPMFLADNEKAHLPFIHRFLLTKRGKNLLELASPGGAGRNKTLGQNDFLKLKATIPKLDEQRKIADFLGAVDSKLDALRRKKSGLETFKVGLMQLLFTQALRFTRDDGADFPDWEERELAEIGVRPKTKNTDFDITRVLTNSAVQGIVDQGDYFDKNIANAENIGGYYIVRIGDFVYNPRISASAPVGPINRNTLADGVMSPLYTVFRINSGNFEFYAQYFLSNIWHDYMKSVANYGARHDRMAISNADFMAMPLPWPYPDEQRKIADALSALDAKIAAVADQITHMETFKKGLLQQMFV